MSALASFSNRGRSPMTDDRFTNENIIQALLWALKPLTNLRGSIPLPFVITFLFVALDEGKGVCDYARATGFHRSMMSRYLRDIGDRARNGGPGLGLVTIERHPKYAHRSQVILTVKGRALAKQIFDQVRMAAIFKKSALDLGAL
jgi:hypothetical protein